MLPTLNTGDLALLHLQAGDARASLVLQRDPARECRALAHVSGYALSYWDRDLPPAIRPSLLQFASRVASQTGSVAPLSDVMETLRAGLPSTTQLTFRRRILAGQVTPRWPITLRGGPPTSLSEGLWPYDPELAGLRAGTRQLIKRDWLPPSQLRRDQAWLSDTGYRFATTSAAGSDASHRVLFVARDVVTLERAVEEERALSATSDRQEAASQWFGDMLGYPECCRLAFARLRPRGDLTLMAELLPPPPTAHFSPLTQWLLGPLALISHSPCRLDCPATQTLASTLAQSLESERPGFRAHWENLTRALHLIDRDGRCILLNGPGAPGQIKVASATELKTTQSGAGVVTQMRHDLVGQTVAMMGDALIGPGIFATLVADHRGSLR